MKFFNNNLRAFLLANILLLLPLLSYGGDCSCPKRTLKNILQENRDSGRDSCIYMWGKVLGTSKHIYTGASMKAFDVQVFQYWSDKPMAFGSDTLVIFSETDPCGQNDLSEGLQFLLALGIENDILYNRHCSGSAPFEQYVKDIVLLGKPQYRNKDAVAGISKAGQKQETPKLTKKERKSQLLIWLMASLALNFFAILLILLLKRADKGS
ncbi:MAG: hypothetical protein JWM28_3533 [Chitinophagaceae bacterium]|nr:hypothetical protein [Chitinophagaceae bacterium]